MRAMYGCLLIIDVWRKHNEMESTLIAYNLTCYMRGSACVRASEQSSHSYFSSLRLLWSVPES
jgi:hypothetical protein